jgi:hypothetical protein
MTTAETEACPVVQPVGHQGRESVPPADGLGSVASRPIAVLDISKVRSDTFADAVERAVRDAGAASVERGIAPPSQRLSDDDLRELAGRNDGAVLALADCGTCTSWTMFDAVELHRHGCRAVLVTTEALRPMVDALAPRLGLAELPIVEVALPNREQTADEIRSTAEAAGPAIVQALSA